MSIVLSFDIGIKNLAFCCLKKTESGSEILGWENVNLIEDTTTTKQACRLGCTSI